MRTHLPKRLAGVWIARIDSPIGLAIDDRRLLGYELAREELLTGSGASRHRRGRGRRLVTRRGATDLARADGAG